jgi:hypothetical protein
MSDVTEKRIVIEFREKARSAAHTEFMPVAEAEAEFERVSRELADAGTEGDRWLRVGNGLVVRPQEVHSMRLEAPLTASWSVEPIESIWNKQF